MIKQSLKSSAKLGCLLVGLLLVASAHAAPVEPDLCTARGIEDYLDKTSNKGDVELVYEHCRAEFLARSKISPAVKQTIDEWVGTDLSKAETNQIFLAYELALVGPKPEQLAADFEGDCRRMVADYQAYRDAVEPLTARVDIDLDSLLIEGDAEVEEDERDLLNFVQYSQFCKSLLKEARDEGQEADRDDDGDVKDEDPDTNRSWWARPADEK